MFLLKVAPCTGSWSGFDLLMGGTHSFTERLQLSVCLLARA
jgi:hypothetical protein